VTRPIFEPSFWSERLRTAKEPHHSVFVCPKARWDAIAANHRAILARHIKPDDKVFEAACGWGRLLDLMPDHWKETGAYIGVDLSPDFVAMAKGKYPGRSFFVADLRALPEVWSGMFDWCVMVSLRGMVIREAGAAEWDRIERELRRVAKRILVLEYDENEEGVVIV
jgi:ubiquinone/menaquinone biosynthesis C-methylase UbiE